MTTASEVWTRSNWVAGQTGHNVLHNQIRDRISRDRYVTDPDVGATGDGESDDTAALQAAFSAGGEWVIPAGNYRFSTLTVPSNTRIYAAEGAVLEHVGNDTDPGILLGDEFIQLHNLKIKCVSGSSPAGILSEGAHDVVLDNVRVNGNGNDASPAFRYSEAALLISGGNWHWDVYGGKYEQSNGHCLELRGGGAVMNFYGVHFYFAAGYGVHQYNQTDGFALQMTGCTLQGSYTGQMWCDFLLGAHFNQCHFENSDGATCNPVRLGSNYGACIGVAFTGCNFSAKHGAYCLDLDTIGSNRGITVQSCRLAGEDGYIVAGINAKKASNCMFTANVLFPHAGFPHVKTTGDGYYPSNLFIQDEESCGVQYLT